MHLRTMTVLGVSAALCAAALTVPPASAAPTAASTPTSARTAPGGASDLARGARPVSRMIVQMADRGRVTEEVTDAVAMAAGVAEAKPGRRLAGGARLVTLSEPVPLADAMSAAARVTARGDVAYAQPDTWIQVASANPAGWDDAALTQWDIWDDAQPAGGFGSRAPVAWERTKGDPSVVVAVVDTGITRHPDLDANVVAGYDFIDFDDAPPFGGLNLQPYTANDGGGRDADPSDPGDWVTATEQDSPNWFRGCQQEPSTWHGTHVSGTVAAVQDNGVGVQGVAPRVRLQPVRAVGKCGGYLSDIADGIRWAAGGTVPGAPANATPAKVINVSLGGPGACDGVDTNRDPIVNGYMQNAIDEARALGATVVVAAGNSNGTVAYDKNVTLPDNVPSGSTPANCSGVVVVGAVGRDGARASTYSNYGPEVLLSAQGGAAFSTTEGVISTINAGTTRPTTPTYGGAAYVGTSMAAPHVAGAVALLQSTRAASKAWFTPAEIADILVGGGGFPGLIQAPSTPCDKPCGAGVLDLSQPLPAAPPGPPTDVLAQGRDTATGVLVSWAAPTDDGTSPVLTYEVQRSADGGAWTTVDTVAGTSLTDAAAATTGVSYEYRVRATNAVGPSQAWGVADPTQVYDVAPPLVPSFVAVAAAGPGVLRIDWASPDSGPAASGYEMRYRKGDGAWSDPQDVDQLFVTALTGLTSGTYEVQVRSVGAGTGQWSAPRSASVVALAQGLVGSATTIRPFVDGFQDGSVTFTSSSNAPAGGTLTITGGPTVVTHDVVLDGTGTDTFTWTPPAPTPGVAVTYFATLALTRPWDSTPATVGQWPVTVRDSQVGTPSVSRSASSVYPYQDSYRDTVTLKATTNVPATQSWRIRNSKGTTVRTWSYSTPATSRSVTWNGRSSSGTLLPAGSYTVTVTTKGGTGTATSRSTTVSISAKRLRSASFSITLYPSSASITALQGSKYLVNKAYDGITKAELLVRGGPDGGYDVLALSTALPSSTIPQTSVKVATCLRRSPPGNDNLLVAGYMASTTRYAGWFSALVDETQDPGLSSGLNEVTVASGTIDCRTPTLSTPATAIAGNRVRWSLFNLGPSRSGSVAVYSFKVTGKRYYLA